MWTGSLINKKNIKRAGKAVKYGVAFANAYRQMTEVLPMDNLLPDFLANNVITKSMGEALSAMNSKSEKTDYLLNGIQQSLDRGEVSQFEQLMQAMQSYVQRENDRAMNELIQRMYGDINAYCDVNNGMNGLMDASNHNMSAQQLLLSQQAMQISANSGMAPHSLTCHDVASLHVAPQSCSMEMSHSCAASCCNRSQLASCCCPVTVESLNNQTILPQNIHDVPGVPHNNHRIPAITANSQYVPAMTDVPQNNQSVPAMTGVPQSVPAMTAVPQSVPAMTAVPQSVPAMAAVLQSNKTVPTMTVGPQNNPQTMGAVPQFNHSVLAKTAISQRNQSALDPRLTQSYFPRTNLTNYTAKTNPMYGPTIGNTLPQRNFPTVIDGHRLPHNYMGHTMPPSPSNSYRNYVPPSHKQTIVPDNNVIHVPETPHTVLTLPATQSNSHNQTILAVPTGHNAVQYISLEQHVEQRSPRTPTRSSTSLKQVSYSRADTTTSERSIPAVVNSRSYKKGKSLLILYIEAIAFHKFGVTTI